MTAIAQTTRTLPALANAIDIEHRAAESSYQSALEHALNAGRMLVEVKDRLERGEWLTWLANSTKVSERNAQRYMQLAREHDEDPTRVSGSIRGALHDVQEPREPRADLAAGLRAAGLGAVDVREEVESRPARQQSWPRPGMERRTWQDIGKLIDAAGRSRESATTNGLNDWSRKQALLAAAGQLRDASELLTELAGTLGT